MARNIQEPRFCHDNGVALWNIYWRLQRLNLSSIDPRTWERSHAGSAYYAPVADRPNLHLLVESLVEKIILEKSESDVVATGVQFTRNGRCEIRKARKEVLLCAGVFQSPQILELSGIGSRKLLQSHGIDIVVENTNVGENLQDHPMSGMSFEVIDGLPTIDMIRDPNVIQGAMEAYQTSRAGPLTSGYHSVPFRRLPPRRRIPLRKRKDRAYRAP